MDYFPYPSIPDGLITYPGLNYALEPTTGLQRSAAGTVSHVILGVQRFRVSAIGGYSPNSFFVGGSYADDNSIYILGKTGSDCYILAANVAGRILLESNMAVGTVADGVRVWNIAGNRTAGNLLSVGDGVAYVEKWAVNFDGKMKYIAANTQATVGAAGAAAALPAAPLGYFLMNVVGTGNVAVPYYNP